MKQRSLEFIDCRDLWKRRVVANGDTYADTADWDLLGRRSFSHLDHTLQHIWRRNNDIRRFATVNAFSDGRRSREGNVDVVTGFPSKCVDYLHHAGLDRARTEHFDLRRHRVIHHEE